MGSRTVNGFDGAALVNRNIHYDRAFTHLLHHILLHQLGGTGAGNQHGPYQQIGSAYRLL
ncbi:hypothetical protein D3C80_2022670 [compost metagenome]